jgi:hypothetical protein
MLAIKESTRFQYGLELRLAREDRTGTFTAMNTHNGKRSRTRLARQPAITSLVESELDPPVAPHHRSLEN